MPNIPWGGRRSCRFPVAIVATVWVFCIAVMSVADAALPPSETVTEPSAPESAEIAELTKERLAAERFLTVLEQNPRRGTALDKVYSYHVDQGSLDTLIDKYHSRVKQQPQDGSAAGQRRRRVEGGARSSRCIRW